METDPRQLATRSLELLDQAERSRLRAERRKEQIRLDVEAELRQRHLVAGRTEPSANLVATVADTRAASDPHFKRHANANQWYLTQATAFASVAAAAHLAAPRPTPTDLSCGSL